jgi:hypothetical protein
LHGIALWAIPHSVFPVSIYCQNPQCGFAASSSNSGPSTSILRSPRAKTSRHGRVNVGFSEWLPVRQIARLRAPQYPVNVVCAALMNSGYPVFVAKLKDGRLFVVEYKGGDRFSADQEKEKRLVGELWEKRSGGKGLYLMAQMSDDKGRDVREQLLAKIAGR